MNTIRIALAVSAGLALAPPAIAAARAGAAAAQGDADRVRAHVHRVLTTEGQVSERDAAEVDRDVSRHAGEHGYGARLSQAIHDALAKGCKGACLVDAVHAINHPTATAAPAGASQGASHDAHASGMTDDARARADDHREDAARRDAGAENVRDRTAGHGQAWAHATGAGHR